MDIFYFPLDYLHALLSLGAAILAAKHDRLARMWRLCATDTQGLTLTFTQETMMTNGSAHKFNKTRIIDSISTLNLNR